MRELNPTGVRLDNELKAKSQQSAKDNKRSLNSEIVARLQASYDHSPIMARIARLDEQIAIIENRLNLHTPNV